jgi:hypothetical protein
MPNREVGFLVHYLFDGDKGREFVERIDRRVDRLPDRVTCASGRAPWRVSLLP